MCCEKGLVVHVHTCSRWFYCHFQQTVRPGLVPVEASMKRDLQIHLFCKPRVLNRVEFLLLQVKLHPCRIGVKIQLPHVKLLLLCSCHTRLVNLLQTTRMKLSVTGNMIMMYLSLSFILHLEKLPLEGVCFPAKSSVRRLA